MGSEERLERYEKDLEELNKKVRRKLKQIEKVEAILKKN
jgi:ABC-type Zn uptake system ZnuABC Zn-binding protein ZnuA